MIVTSKEQAFKLIEKVNRALINRGYSGLGISGNIKDFVDASSFYGSHMNYIDGDGYYSNEYGFGIFKSTYGQYVAYVQAWQSSEYVNVSLSTNGNIVSYDNSHITPQNPVRIFNDDLFIIGINRWYQDVGNRFGAEITDLGMEIL